MAKRDVTPIVCLAFGASVKESGETGKPCTIENHTERGVNLVMHDPAGVRLLIEDLTKLYNRYVVEDRRHA